MIDDFDITVQSDEAPECDQYETEAQYWEEYDWIMSGNFSYENYDLPF